MSTIKVDKLQGTSGSDTAMTFSGANSTFNGVLTVPNTAVATTEVGGTTINLVQGLLKHFGSMQGTDTFAGSIDSFNQASATDHGTGDHSITNTSAFRESRPVRQVYTHNTVNEGSSAAVGADRGGTVSSGNGGAAPTTTVFRFNVYYGAENTSDGALIDLSYLYIIGAGDLA